MAIRERLSKMFGRGKELAKGKLYSTSKKRSKITEEAPTRREIEKLEKLYYMEPLLFSGINMYVSYVAAADYDLIGKDTKALTLIEKFIEDSDFDDKLLKIMQDLLIYGNAFVELLWNMKGDEIVDIGIIDPKSMKFIKNKEGKVLTKDDGKPVGYVQKVTAVQTDVLERILRDEGIPLTDAQYSSGIPFKAEDIAHLRYHTLGDTMMGVGLVEPMYDTVYVKLQVEEDLGAVISKIATPTYHTKIGMKEVHDPDPEEIRDFSRDTMAKIEDIKEVTTPYYYDITTIGVERIDRLQGYLQYFTEQICSGLGIPHSLLLKGERVGTGVTDLQEEQFEKNVRIFQKTLSYQIKREIFEPMCATLNISKDAVPRIEWKIFSPRFLSRRARRLGEFARAGYITPDDNIEEQIRREEELPELVRTKEEEQRRTELRKEVLKGSGNKEDIDIKD